MSGPASQTSSAPWWRRLASSGHGRLSGMAQVARRMSNKLFWGIVVGLTVMGTTLLLMLNVTLQNQAFELRHLEAEASSLENQQAALEDDLTSRAATDKLADRAMELGMVPNTSAGYLKLPEGTLSGTPQAAGGTNPFAPRPTDSPTPTPSPTASATASPSPSASPAPSPSAAASPSTVASPSAAASPSPSPTPSEDASPAATSAPGPADAGPADSDIRMPEAAGDRN